MDPGETTGWALWEGRELVDAGQEELIPFIDLVADGALVGTQRVSDATEARHFGLFAGIRRLVIEEFRLYPWIIHEGGLDFDEVRTARGIGALEFIARHGGLEVVMQPATIKAAAEAGGARELFQRPLHENRHANDAIRHGWFYITTVMLGRRVELPHASVIAINPDEPYSPEEEE